VAYADEVNILGKNINTVNENRGSLSEASRQAGLEVKREKIDYMVVSLH
jgi:hypothetical protein